MLNKEIHITTFTDEALFLRVKENSDEAAFAELYDRHWKRLFQIAFGKVGNRQIGENIVQDLFTNIWKRRKKTVIQKSFASYLNSALRYIIINHYRAIKVRKDYAEGESTKVLSNGLTTDKLVSYNELFQSIQREVDNLPKRCSEIFKMSRFDHMSNREIAETLEISSKTVENQITKAIKLLRYNLKELISLALTFFLF